MPRADARDAVALADELGGTIAAGLAGMKERAKRPFAALSPLL